MRAPPDSPAQSRVAGTLERVSPSPIPGGAGASRHHRHRPGPYVQDEVDKKPAFKEIPRTQGRALARALSDYAKAHERDEAIALAYLSGQHTMAKIAEHFGVHYTTVSRLVKVYEKAQREEI